ncbi:hypothetical protein BDZ45DRAFT_244250 [Acephala macrosclerotiorum]|nr:hypothetical protein BDZ45DRAFT_244250 [Acephala macrosclerotiorum]
MRSFRKIADLYNHRYRASQLPLGRSTSANPLSSSPSLSLTTTRPSITHAPPVATKAPQSSAGLGGLPATPAILPPPPPPPQCMRLLGHLCQLKYSSLREYARNAVESAESVEESCQTVPSASEPIPIVRTRVVSTKLGLKDN